MKYNQLSLQQKRKLAFALVKDPDNYKIFKTLKFNFLGKNENVVYTDLYSILRADPFLRGYLNQPRRSNLIMDELLKMNESNLEKYLVNYFDMKKGHQSKVKRIVKQKRKEKERKERERKEREEKERKEREERLTPPPLVRQYHTTYPRFNNIPDNESVYDLMPMEYYDDMT